MDLQFVLASVFFGLLPEAVYFTLFLCFAKELEHRRLFLFGLIFASSLILSAFLAFSVWYYILSTAAMWGILRLLYKSQFVDLFLIGAADVYLALLGFAFINMPNYWIALAANRVLLFVGLFLSRGRLNRAYLTYLSVWNVNPDAKIKSLTVRNISMVCLNIMIFAFNIMSFRLHAIFFE